MHKEIKTIATHSGKFHADDLFGVATLKLLYPDAQVVRSRDPEVLSRADVRIDVGGVHDPGRGDFDHHQKGFSKMRDNGVPYASFGLVWDVFGEQACKSGDIALKIEEKLVQPIDAIDNGFDMCSAPHVIMPYSVSHIVAALNPSWDSSTPHDEAFTKALDFAMYVLRCVIEQYQGSAKADKVMQEKMNEFEGVPYVILDEYIPSGYLSEHSDKWFVVYPDTNNFWTIKGVPRDKGGFEPRVLLPESWAGLNNEELARVSGVDDAQFCHRGRWICSARSKEGALKMLEIALRS